MTAIAFRRDGTIIRGDAVVGQITRAFGAYRLSLTVEPTRTPTLHPSALDAKNAAAEAMS